MKFGLKMMVVTGVATLALSACGGATEGETAPTGGETETAAAAGGWDATDACALLDKAAVGEALGDTVTGTSIGLVNQAAGANAAGSECTYMLAGGSRATLMARWSPIADNTDDAIKLARSTMQETVSAFGKTIEDVPNLGKAAFYVPGIDQMNVYIDDRKFVILTIPTPKSGAAKDVAIALIGKIKK